LRVGVRVLDGQIPVGSRLRQKSPGARSGCLPQRQRTGRIGGAGQNRRKAFRSAGHRGLGLACGPAPYRWADRQRDVGGTTPATPVCHLIEFRQLRPRNARRFVDHWPNTLIKREFCGSQAANSRFLYSECVIEHHTVANTLSISLGEYAAAPPLLRTRANSLNTYLLMR